MRGAAVVVRANRYDGSAGRSGWTVGDRGLHWHGDELPKARPAGMRHEAPEWGWAIPPTLVATVLVLYDLGEKALWRDEATTLRIAKLPWPDFAGRAFGDQSFTGLYYLIARASTALGDDPFVIRLPSALFAVATVPFVFLIGRRLIGREGALLAAFLLAVNAFFVRYAQEARAYSLALLLVTVATYLLLRTLDRPTLGRWGLYVAVAATAVYAHSFAAFVLVTHVAVLLRHQSLRNTLIAYGAIAALTAPLIISVMLSGPTREWIPPFTDARVGRAVHQLAGGPQGEAGIHGLAYVVLVGLALGSGIARGRWWPHSLLFGWLVLPFVGGAVLTFMQPAWVPRYFIVALPPLALLAADAVASLRPRWLTVLPLGSLSVLALYGLHWWYVIHDKGPPS